MLLLATFDYREIYKTNGLRYLNRVFKFQNFEKESKFGTMQLLLHVTTVANSVVYFSLFFSNPLAETYKDNSTSATMNMHNVKMLWRLRIFSRIFGRFI